MGHGPSSIFSGPRRCPPPASPALSLVTHSRLLLLLGCTLATPAFAASGVQDAEKSWPGEMPYVLSGYSDLDKAQIEKSIHYMRQTTGFAIVPRTNQENYLLIRSGKGCSSPAGMVGGEQVVSLNSAHCLSRRNTVHTLMHALGFFHEQGSPNRDDGLDVHLENIQPAWREAFRKESLRNAGVYSSFNADSIMMYPRTHPSMSIKGRPAFDCKPKSNCDNDRAGTATELSNGDIAGLGNMFMGHPEGTRDPRSICPEEGWRCDGAKVLECKMEKGFVTWHVADTCEAPLTCLLRAGGQEGATCVNPARILPPLDLSGLGPYGEPPPAAPPSAPKKEKAGPRKR
nr:M12 family metallopeptidase [Corallococcus exiguus]